MISPSKVLLLCLFALHLLYIAQSQESPQSCSPNVILPNTLKDVITFISAPNSTNYSYPFIARMFQSTPSIVMAINTLNFTQISTEIGFGLQGNFGANSINFVFEAPNLQWAMAGITFWIVSRADLYVGTLSLSSNLPATGTIISSSVTINSSLQLFAANNTVLLPFITSLNLTSTNSNFSIQVARGTQSNFTYSLTTSIGASSTLNNLIVTFIVYNPLLSAFANNGGNITYFSLQGSQYSNIHNNIMPIYYQMLGFSGLSLSGNNSHRLSFKIDVIDDYVLQVSADTVIDQLTVDIGTIGALPASVCSPCNNFIFQSSCVDMCPTLTYSYSYTTFASSNGTIGKSCLICSKHLNEVINQFSTGCVCIPGYQRINGVCGLIVKRCTGANQIESNNTCICSPGTVNISGVCGVCPNATLYNGSACIPVLPIIIPPPIPLPLTCTDPNSHANPQNTACICNAGYTTIANSPLCQPICNLTNHHQVFNPITTLCQCIPNFYNISGVCTECVNGTAFNGTGCAEVNCTNGTLVNGKCVCSVGSVRVGNLCVPCLSGYYADQTANQCYQCLPNCQKCIDKLSCTLCSANYIWNSTNQACSLIVGPTTTSQILLAPTYPRVSPVGLVTDFQLPLVSPFPTLTPSTLSSIISYTVNDTSALPLAVYYSQNPSQGNLIRAFFQYSSGLLPVNPFQVQYNFNSTVVNIQNTLNVIYDMKGPLQFTHP